MINKTIKILEENTVSILFDVGLSNIFLYLSAQTMETKAKVNKRNFIKLKSSFIVKENINKTKKQTTK